MFDVSSFGDSEGGFVWPDIQLSTEAASQLPRRVAEKSGVACIGALAPPSLQWSIPTPRQQLLIAYAWVRFGNSLVLPSDRFMLSSGCAPERNTTTSTSQVPLLDASSSDESHLRQFLSNPAIETYLALLPADVLRLTGTYCTATGPRVAALGKGSVWEADIRVMCHGRHVVAVRGTGPNYCLTVVDLESGFFVWSSPGYVSSALLLACVDSRGLIYSVRPAEGLGCVWRPPQNSPIHEFSYPGTEHARMLAIGERVLILDAMRIFEVSLTLPLCSAVTAALSAPGLRFAITHTDWLCNYTAYTASHGTVAIWVYARGMIVFFLDCKIANPLQAVKTSSSGSPAVFQSRLFAPDGSVYDLSDLTKPVIRQTWYGDLWCLPSGEPYLVIEASDHWRLCVLSRDGRIVRTQRFIFRGDDDDTDSDAAEGRRRDKEETTLKCCVTGDTLIACVSRADQRSVVACKLWQHTTATALRLLYLPADWCFETPVVHSSHLVMQAGQCVRCAKLTY